MYALYGRQDQLNDAREVLLNGTPQTLVPDRHRSTVVREKEKTSEVPRFFLMRYLRFFAALRFFAGAFLAAFLRFFAAIVIT
jgi:hypothetical protein